jgi:acetylglutamate kinase
MITIMNTKLENIIVIKLGGSIFASKDTSIEDIVKLQKDSYKLILVHGGANVTSKWMAKLDLDTEFVNGERITDLATLEIVTAVLGGLVNKEIVAAIIEAGGQAVGLSGVDGGILQGKMKNKEMGYMGNVARVNPKPLFTLLEAGIMPVVSPVSLHSVDRPKDTPLLLNINGDPAAGAIAAAVGAERLIFLTDIAGIKNKKGQLLRTISPVEAKKLLSSGVASGGMVPKINACLKAISGGTKTCIIDGTKPHILIEEVEGEGSGTVIEAD